MSRLLLLLDVWPLQRFTISTIRRDFVQEKIPFFILTLIVCMITLAAQHSSNALASLAQIPLTQRFATAVVSLVGYIKRGGCPLQSFQTGLSAGVQKGIFARVQKGTDSERVFSEDFGPGVERWFWWF